MISFLHKKGYTYFTIPDLTYPEINGLVDSANRKAKRQESEHKKMERKNKRGRRRFR